MFTQVLPSIIITHEDKAKGYVTGTGSACNYCYCMQQQLRAGSQALFYI